MIDENIQSPCCNLCRLNDMKVCLGCYRTLEEIAAWGMLSNKEKTLVLSEVEHRKCELIRDVK